MKRSYIFALLQLLICTGVFAQNEIVNIPDENFKKTLLRFRIDKNNDGEIQQSEAIAFKGKLSVGSKDISELTGIEAFVNITELECYENKLTTLNLSNNTKLESVHCANNQLTGLNVSNCTKLKKILCYNNQLTQLDITDCSELENLQCYSNKLEQLDVSNNIELKALLCSKNRLTQLDVSANIKLYQIYINHNQLTELDIANNVELIYLNCFDNKLAHIDLSNNVKLASLYCQNNQLTKLDFSVNSKLEYVQCNNNLLKEIDAYKWKNYKEFDCENNKLCLSELWKIKSTLSDRSKFDYNPQNEIFDISYQAIGSEKDYSSELNIDDVITEFEWYNATDDTKVDETVVQKITDGKYRFLKPGKYYCIMTNYKFRSLKLKTSIIYILKDQELAFDPPATANINDKITLNATSLSGLDPEYKIVSGKATLNDNTLIPTAEGTLVVKAVMSGNNEYSATEKEATIIVNKCSQTLTFTPPANATVKDKITLQATVSSGLNVTYKIVSGEATLKGNVLTPTAGGELIIKAVQDGNEIYAPVEKQASIQIDKIRQTLSFTPPEFADVDDKIVLEATASSGLDVVYKIVSGKAILKENALTPTAGGDLIIKAIQAGNDEYSAVEKECKIKIWRLNQTLTFAPQATAKIGDVITLEATTSSGLDVAFKIISGEAELKGNKLTITSGGTIIIKALQTGNEKYLPVEKEATIKIAKKDHTLIFTSQTSAKVNDKISLNATVSSGIDITYEVVSGKATLNGNIMTPTAEGELIVKAVSGNNEYNTVEKSVTIQVTKRDQTITFDSPVKAKVNDKINLNATSSSGLDITYEIVSGKATLNGNMLTPTAEGILVIKAVQAGDNVYVSASKQLTIDVEKRQQIITFDSPVKAKVNDKINLNATSSSGLGITYEIVSGEATLNGNLLTPTAVGSLVLKAVQAGDNVYESALKQLTIDVEKRQQTITFDSPVKAKVNDKINLNATSSSGLDITYEIVSGEATLNGNILTPTAEGILVIKAVQAGDKEYESALKQLTIDVEKRQQTITFDSPVKAKVNDKINLNATSSSGLDITYEIVSGEAIIDGNILTVTAEGAIVIKAVQAGNTEYAKAEKEVTIQVSKHDQTITFDIQKTVFVNDKINLNATVSSGLDITYEVVSGEATLDGNTLTPTAEGELVIKAVQGGNTEYNSLEKEVTIQVTKRNQTITFDVKETVKVNDKITLAATASSGLDITYKIVSGNATLNGNTVTFTDAGKVQIKAIQAGNNEYKAVEKTVDITVTKSTAIDNLSAIGAKIYPNPVTGILNIELPETGSYTVTVFNSTGDIISQKTTSSVNTAIDMSAYNSGIYIIKVTTGNRSYTGKVIKR
ncbi:MAG: T9SS type A sorting domain-containing protein [Bacteroidales bacterium]|nr:T9SS type A sorting domain-containing protein [Bacteroidales bacterium]